MMITGKRILSASAGVILGATVVSFLFTAPAHAGSATATLAIAATVVNNCTISTAAVAFGSYDPVVANASADLDSTGSITIACTKGATSTIGLNVGGNASGSTRRLTDGSSNYLTYEVYKEAARTNVWGNSGADLYTPAVAPNKSPRTFTVYGRVTSNQDVPAGGYADTITSTVNF